MVDVFVSYSSSDRERVRPLVDRLTAEGCSVWWDRHIESGSQWDTQIENALETARCVVVVWTANSVASDWVRNEAIEAQQANKLVPVMLEDVRLPLAFRRTQARRLIGWPEVFDRFELDKLLTDVRQQLQGSGRKATRAALLDADRSERRQISVLQLAFDGSDALALALDPEALDDWARDFEQRLRATATLTGGVLLTFDLANCGLAFGVAVTLEDDEVCAAEMAFALARCVPTLPAGHAIGIRCGLASGMMVVGPGATPSGWRLSGNVVIHATALVAQARPGQLLVSTATRRRLAPYFDTEAAGAAFVVLARTTVRNRIDAARMLGFSPLVARREELGSLEAALEDVLAGSGRALCVLGDAGLGKSRLNHEFGARMGEQEVLVVEGRCVAYGQTSSYGPFAALLRDVLRLGEVNATQLEATAVHRLLAIDAGLAPYLPQLLHLLAIRSAAHALPDTLEGLALRRSLGQALVAVLSLASNQQAIVLTLEDWHWADEASRDVLPQLLEVCASQRVLILVCARPEAAPPWPALSHCSQLVLRPLNKAQVGELVRSISRAEALDTELATLVHARTDGVPLFVEELTRELLEQGHIHLVAGRLVAPQTLDAVSLPGSIEAVVRARLDRLEPEALELLRVAAVVGRQFGRRMLDDLFDDAETVSERLAVLVAQGLVQQARVVPEPEYRFRHLLTQVVAYESLLLKQRRALHQRVGELVERRHAGHLDEQLELLAHHFQQAGVDDKAIDYLMRAGTRAARNVALLAAVEHFSRAVVLLEAQAASPARDDRLLQACVALGNARILIQGYAAAPVVQVYARARELSREVSASPARFACLWMLWRYYYNRALLAEAAEFAEEMTVQARAMPAGRDDGQLLAAHTALGVVQFLGGHAAGARAALEPVLTLWRADGERELAFRFGMSPAVQAHAFLGIVLVMLGEPARGRDIGHRAIDIARQIDHPGSLALALQYHCTLLMALEEVVACRPFSDELAALATRHELRHWLTIARLQRGVEMIAMGDFAAGLALHGPAAAAVDAMGVRMSKGQQLVLLAMVALKTAQLDEGLALMDQAQATMDDGGMRYFEPEVLRLRARLLWPRDVLAARAAFELAREAALAQHSLLAMLRIASDAAALMAQAGDLDEARAWLLPAWLAFAGPERRHGAIFTRIGQQLAALGHVEA